MVSGYFWIESLNFCDRIRAFQNFTSELFRSGRYRIYRMEWVFQNMKSSRTPSKNSSKVSILFSCHEDSAHKKSTSKFHLRTFSIWKVPYLQNGVGRPKREILQDAVKKIVEVIHLILMPRGQRTQKILCCLLRAEAGIRRWRHSLLYRGTFYD